MLAKSDMCVGNKVVVLDWESDTWVQPAKDLIGTIQTIRGIDRTNYEYCYLQGSQYRWFPEELALAGNCCHEIPQNINLTGFNPKSNEVG